MKSTERKTLIRNYKEARRPRGIFRVRNTISGKMLVGSSMDLPGMLNRQRWQLSQGMHVNRKLQEDWNTLGPEAFAFEILDTLPERDETASDPAGELRTLEQLWLDQLAPYGDKGYNAPCKTR